MDAMPVASSPAKSGTWATVFQVTTKSRRRISAANPVARMPAGTANMAMPSSMVQPAKMRPPTVMGVMSP